MTRSRAARPIVLGVTGVLCLLLLWELAPLVGLVSPRAIPPLHEVVASLGGALVDAKFWIALGDTLITWALGFTIAATAAIVIGTVVGLVPFLRRSTHTTIEFLRPIPSVAIIPLAILMFGLQREAALVIVVFATFWQVLVQVLYGVADVDSVARDTARSFGLGPAARLRYVVLPTALPYLVTGLRLGGTVALILTITAEMVIQNPGLGYRLNLFRSAGDAPGVYAMVVVTGMLGLLINVALRLAERRVLAWHHSVRADVSA